MIEDLKPKAQDTVTEWIAAIIFYWLVGMAIWAIASYGAIFYLISGLITGLICVSMAETRGRSRPNAFVGGSLFGMLAILYYLIIGKTTELRVYEEELARLRFKKDIRSIYKD